MSLRLCCSAAKRQWPEDMFLGPVSESQIRSMRSCDPASLACLDLAISIIVFSPPHDKSFCYLGRPRAMH
jgi:hypothetical protein